jgi:hypothetical protein
MALTGYSSATVVASGERFGCNPLIGLKGLGWPVEIII